MIGQDPPVPTNRVDLDPTVRDVYGLPVARITYAHHPNDLAVQAVMTVFLTEMLGAMGATSTQPVVPLGIPTAIPQGGDQTGLETGPLRGFPPTIGGLVNHQMGTMRMGPTPTPRCWTRTVGSGAFPTSTSPTGRSSPPRAATTRR